MDIVQSSNRIVNSFPPLNNITPFTRVDGWSFLEVLEGLRHYIVDILVPENNALIDNINKIIDEMIKLVDDKIVESHEEFQQLLNVYMENVNIQLGLMDDKIDLINNKSGGIDVQHYQVGVEPLVINVKPEWPNNLPIQMTVTAVENNPAPVSFSESVDGIVNIVPIDGAITEFTLMPYGDGRFFIVQLGDTFNYYNTVSGYESMQNGRHVGIAARNNNAYGKRALYNLRKGRYNDFFGLEAGFSLDGYGFSESQMNATRNSGFGSNTQRFNKIGYNNVSMGRNAMQCLTSASNNIAIGAGAMSGYAHVGYEGEIINVLPKNPDKNVGIGTNALFNSSGIDNTMLGTYAGQNIKNLHNNVGIGRNALANLDVDSADNGFVKKDLNTAAGLTIESGVMTVKLPEHPFKVGSLIHYTHAGYESQYYYVKTVVDTDTVILDWNYPASLNLPTAAITIVYYTLPTDDFGRSRGWNTAVGTFALTNMKGSVYGTNENGLSTAIGYRALAENVDGSPAYNVWHCVGLGAATKPSGTNQVLLGSESTTPYAYQPVQVRSDIRDKADIKPNPLGLNFINKLNPVQYKWDRRDSYASENQKLGREFGYRDGKHKGKRYHNGFIAQEVKAVADNLGEDFAGYQDHSVSGGLDIKSLAYEELIAPMVKAIQELSAMNSELKSRIAKLENK